MRLATMAILATGAALLAGCDTRSPESAPEETTIAIDGKEVTVGATPSAEPTEAPVPLDPASPADGTPDSAPPLPDTAQQLGSAATDDGAPLNAIPARFLGQWGGVDGPCTPDSEMFLTIRPGTIAFYESQGEVTAVRRGEPGIVVTLAMQGEGESWTSEYAMALVQGGDQLVTRELADGGGATTRRRCAT